MKRKSMDLVRGLMAAAGPLRKDGEKTDHAEEASEPVTMLEPGRLAYHLDNRPPEALVIHCADSRFQTAFRQFLNEELGITHYFPIVVGGGVHAFGLQNLLPKNFKIVWQQIKFALTVGKLKQVVIINHEDCKWYEHLKGYHPTVSPKHKGMLDLSTAAERIIEDFSGVQVRTFWAAIEDHGIVFSEI